MPLEFRGVALIDPPGRGVRFAGYPHGEREAGKPLDHGHIAPEMEVQLVKLRLAEQKNEYYIITELGHMTLVFGG